MQKALSTKQAAERLNATSRQVIRWIHKGYFPNAYKLDPEAINSHFRIPVSDIEAYEERQRGWQSKTK